jgi:Protein of unknown function (DUF2510)
MGTYDDRPEMALPQVGAGMPPPGWYPDPGGGRGLRWWDGARWTAHVAVPIVPPAKPSPGWYPDPAGGRGLRWWDGARWTAHLVVVPTAPPAKPSPGWYPDPAGGSGRRYRDGGQRTDEVRAEQDLWAPEAAPAQPADDTSGSSTLTPDPIDVGEVETWTPPRSAGEVINLAAVADTRSAARCGSVWPSASRPSSWSTLCSP